MCSGPAGRVCRINLPSVPCSGSLVIFTISAVADNLPCQRLVRQRYPDSADVRADLVRRVVLLGRGGRLEAGTGKQKKRKNVSRHFVLRLNYAQRVLMQRLPSARASRRRRLHERTIRLTRAFYVRRKQSGEDLQFRSQRA